MGVQTVTAPSNDNKGDAPQPLIRFTRAAREHVEPGGIDVTQALSSTASYQLGPYDVPAYGYARNLLLYVTATAAGNAAAVAFKEDAPFSALAEIVLTDVNGSQLCGPVSGYELYLINKYGGYQFSPDAKKHPEYVATTGAGASGGSFAFMLRVPIEINAREAFGALPNQNAASTYKLRVTVADSDDIYSTAPTALPSVRVRAFLEAWSQPSATDPFGRPQAQQPPAVGSVQYWTRFIKDVGSGAQTIQLPRVGNLIRNLLFVYRDDATPRVRTTSEFPDDLRLTLDGRELLSLHKDVIRHYMGERYGFATADLDTGLFALDFTHDFDGHPGGEIRDLWLPTAQSTRLELVGTFGGSGGQLTVLTNDVAPVQGVEL